MDDNTMVTNQLHADADALLAESALPDLLAPYGQVQLTGSYRYRLMTVPDIDLHLINPAFDREQVKHLVTDLIAQGFWRGISYEDFVQFPREDLPVGYYIGLKRLILGNFWKIDIWCLTDPSRNLAFDEAMAHLTPKQCQVILAIKHWRREANKLALPSMLIYEAVLQEKAYDVTSFQRWLEERGA